VLLALSAGAAPSVAADLAYGEYLSSECVACHGASVDGGAIPAIAGLSAEDFVAALHAFRSGRRANPVMQNVARSLDDEQIEALAAYFAAQRKGDEP
jgi:cytochrome c